MELEKRTALIPLYPAGCQEKSLPDVDLLTRKPRGTPPPQQKNAHWGGKGNGKSTSTEER